MEIMYPGKVNSRSTMLAEPILATDTSLIVLDASILPPPPNMLSIGSFFNGETVLYTSINGNTVGGLVRGFQGSAKDWIADSLVARMFTEYDYASIVANINLLKNTKVDAYDVRKIVSDYTVTENNYVILCDAAASNINVTLTAAQSILHPINIKKIDSSSNKVTLIGTIDGSPNYVLELKNEFVQLVSDGTNWFIISE